MVERCFNRLKQFRAIATRFDKLADRYKAGVHLAALILWLRTPTPRSFVRQVLDPVALGGCDQPAKDVVGIVGM